MQYKISQSAEFETLLIIGVWDLDVLGRQIENHSGKAVLVEADQEQLNKLASIFESSTNVQLVAGQLGVSKQKAKLSVYNQPGLRGLRPPTDLLRSLFPGLRVKYETIVQRLTAKSLLAQTGPLNEPLHLILNAPGVEAGIFDELHSVGVLAATTLITLYCGRDTFFEDGSSAPRLAAYLFENGFQIENEDLSDPDWPVMTLRRTPFFEAIREAQNQLAALTAERDQAQGQVERGKQESAERISALEAALEGSRGDFENQLAALTAERDQAQGQVERVKQESAERISALEGALETARSDLGTSLRLQQLAQTDIQDLRERFQTILTERDQHAELLAKLIPRLQKAASQLHLLTQGQDAFSSNVLDQELPENSGKLPPKTKTRSTGRASSAARAKKTE